ncbi:U4/U6.U5 tri-snRNP-associated protein 1 [Galendromus occidentalis]|uniref:U4/U6.U5 tri-snRNP-associated protein 1 n=1 Tax=Galendromus occidentalis TaxID=34638 RepID=A0AAJ6QUJ7_9ACAR|nr:U4/U6.U5 tri-snRNP-associated protein 1 [Galendromus occidentalis]
MGSSKKSHKERKRSKKDWRSRSQSSSSSQSDSEIYERRRKKPQKDSKEDQPDKHERTHSDEEERHKDSSKYRDEKTSHGERRDRRESGRPEREKRRSATPEFREATPPDGKEKLSMSIEETNKLRAKLGLKPLQTDDGADEKKGSGENNEIFVRTENISDKKEAEAFREKLRSLRDKQKIKEKYGKVKTLADGDEDDDAEKWIEKSRKLQQDKAKAAAREKLLMEMENELGVDDLVNKELSLKKEYTAKDLRGIEIVHKQDRIKEGDTVVLTLKDHGVLDESEDVLENVNLVDDEKAEKSVLNKKLGIDTYNPYDDVDADEFGIVHKKSVLSKYDEEIDGAKKESFKIGINKEQRKQKELEEIRVKLSKQKESLVLPEPALARDYMTGEEMAAFRKPKKKIRKIRKREILKADDLLPLGDEVTKADHGSRSQRVPKHDTEDDLIEPDQDLSNFKVEDDLPEQRYRSRLQKAKNIVKEDLIVQKVAAQIASIKDEPEDDENSSGVPFAPSMIMNSTAEFCRTLGSKSTYVAKETDETKEKSAFDEDMEVDQEPERTMDLEEEEELKNTWSEVDPSVQQKQKQAQRAPHAEVIPVHLEAFPILEAEPNVAQGVAGALKLALKKGFIEDESKNNPAAVKKLQDLSAKNYQIEEKYYDDEGRGRRGGANNHSHGPVSDFRDKSNYKPDVKLDYIDDSGRLLNQKEAFRYLSHKFHGKGSGKNKIDKRQKKIEQIKKLEQMSSSDTPLNTLKLLQEKQKQQQTPYIMLSGGAANTLSGPSGLSKK